MLHSSFSSIMAFMLYLVCPSLFGSLSGPKPIEVGRRLFLKGALPIALLFSVQLVLSNTAYIHSSVAFLQMMKEANIILVYSFSLLAMLERYSSRHALVLLGVVLA